MGSHFCLLPACGFRFRFAFGATAASHFGACLQFLLLLLTNFALKPSLWPRFITFSTATEKDGEDSVICYACRVSMRNLPFPKGVATKYDVPSWTARKKIYRCAFDFCCKYKAFK